MQLRTVTYALGAFLAFSGSAFAQATNQINFTFKMVPTGSTEACIPGAAGRVTITHSLELVENMHVEVTGLPKNTDFDLFVIQVPNAPFGLSWYMGDMLTDNNGEAVGDFVGRFQIGTFIVAPGISSGSDGSFGRRQQQPGDLSGAALSSGTLVQLAHGRGESWLREHGDAVQLNPQCWGANFEHKPIWEFEGATVLRASLIERRPELAVAASMTVKSR